jgi:putative ABC transport system permease protein
MKQALRMLARDWRAGELRVLAGALVIAVAAITSVAFFGDRIAQGLARDAHQLLGADLVMVADHPWPRETAALLERAGVQRAEGINFISMASAKESQLAGVKAVTENYPLRGRLRIAPAPGAPDAPAERGPAPGTVWLEERLVSALDAPVGARVKLGRAEFQVAAVITLEPERSTSFFNIAPRLMMHIADVPATGLIQTGSRVSYYMYAAGSAQQIKELQKSIPLARGQRIDTLETGRPEVRAAIERAERFLGLTALLAAILAGVAVALGARRFVERHLDGCAVMRCLGATQAQLLRLYGLEFLLLGLGACAAGCAIGYVAQEAIAAAVAEVIRAELPAPRLLPAVQGFLSGSSCCSALPCRRWCS